LYPWISIQDYEKDEQYSIKAEVTDEEYLILMGLQLLVDKYQDKLHKLYDKNTSKTL
jgi:hypothetical protein